MGIDNQLSCVVITNVAAFKNKLQTMILINNKTKWEEIFLDVWEIQYLREAFDHAIWELKFYVTNTNNGVTMIPGGA